MIRRKPKLGGKRAGAGRPPSKEPTLSHVISYRVTPGDLAGASELAEREGTKVSEVGLAALRLAIARGSTR